MGGRGMNRYELWVKPDRGGYWTVRDTAKTLHEAEDKRKRLYRSLGDVSVRILKVGQIPQ